MPTRDPDELRARAAQLLEDSIAAAERGDVAKADELILMGRAYMRAAELAEELKAKTSPPKMGYVDAETFGGRVAKGRGGSTLFHRALQSRTPPLSVGGWAKQHRVPVDTAKSWVKTGASGRPIPREWADAIAAEFVDERGRSLVPAVDRSWPNGIKD